ncbi:MAG TPA: hypothetical protein VFM25_07185 [Verrucomicrobiae bacterium]|nr:hypothetical protein [Verrucomicrobiae bacterium]
MKRRLLIFGAVVAVACIVAALALLRSTVHSQNAVEKYKNQLRAAGEKLTIAELVPPRPESGKNGVGIFSQATNYMNFGFSDILSTNSPFPMRFVISGKAMTVWKQPEIWYNSATNSWDDLGRALEMRGAALDLLREIPEYQQIDFELDYKQGFDLVLPHLSKLKEAAQLLSADVIYKLHQGDAAAAVTNIHVMLSLCKEWNEPLLISQLVRIALAQITFNAQWELLQSDGLSDSQLALLQNDWMKLDFVGPMENTIGMERVLGSLSIEKWRKTPGLSTAWWASGPPPSGSSGDWMDELQELGESIAGKTKMAFWRASWSYDDELWMLQADQILIEAIRQIQKDGRFKNALAEKDRKLKPLNLKMQRRIFVFLTLDLVNSISPFDKMLAAETAKQMVITAIALKRFCLKHKHFPEKLTELTPEYLPAVPRDPVDGKPLRYYLNSDGTFTLYSIGKDAKDDRGDPNPVTGKSRNWLEGRDAVWPQPATAAEIQSFLK